MAAYLYVIPILAIGGVTLVLQKTYQKKFFFKTGNAFVYPMYLCLFGVPVYLLLAKFRIEFSIFSFICGLLHGTLNGLLSVLVLFVMRYNKQATYSVFVQFFGLIIPFVYGAVFLNEAVSWNQYVGFACMLLAVGLLFFQKKGEKMEFHFILLCILCGCLSGAMSVISKFHQISPYAVSTESFLIYVNIGMFLVTGVALLVTHNLHGKTEKRVSDSQWNDKEEREEKAEIRKKNIWRMLVVLAISWLGAASSMLSMSAQKTIAATVLSPMTTGGSLVVNALIMRTVFKEKITKFLLVAMILIVIGLVLYSL